MRMTSDGNADGMPCVASGELQLHDFSICVSCFKLQRIFVSSPTHVSYMGNAAAHKHREQLITRAACAKYAEAMDLQTLLPAPATAKNMAEAFEALLGAMFTVILPCHFQLVPHAPQACRHHADMHCICCHTTGRWRRHGGHDGCV